MVVERICNMRVLVAEGIIPDYGLAGKLEILVDISRMGKPKILKDGSVDHKELTKVINVKKGDKLVKRIPAKPGKDGCTVLGKKVSIGLPREAILNVKEGTEIHKDDPDILIAAYDGALFINVDGDVEVRQAKVIKGDIDYNTGNISIHGDLKILGTVRSGFSVKAEGSITITGNLEDADVCSASDMEIIGGAVGSKTSKITCGGALKIHHVENFSVSAQKNVTIQSGMLHTDLKTEGHLRAEKIIGGSIEATFGVEADTLGAASETKTIIKIGSTFLLIQQKLALQEKINQINQEITSQKEKIYQLVRQCMDEKGLLNKEDFLQLNILQKQKKKIDDQCLGVQQGIKELTKKININPNPVIKAKLIYPNTLIRSGLLEKVVKQKLTRIIINISENKLNFRSFSD